MVEIELSQLVSWFARLLASSSGGSIDHQAMKASARGCCRV